MRHSNFVHLHLHTQYSLLDGAIRPAELISLAHDYKMPAVAMTDHGNIFGAIEFYEKAMKSGVKPIIGCEIYVAPGERTDKTPLGRGQTTAYHLVLLVKNYKGYQNLCKLLSKAYIEGFYYKPRVDKALLRELNEGLIALGACLHGEVSYKLNKGDIDGARAAAIEYSEIFDKRRYFFELQENGMEEQRKVNKGLIKLSKELNIPLVATNDCHYLRKEDARYHDILLCIQTGTTVNAPNRMKFATDQLYVKSPEEMIEAFRDVPEAISNTIEIAERCNVELKLGENHLPEYPVPEGQTLDTLIDKDAKEGLDKRLRDMAAAGADVESLKWQYQERLAKEMKVIKGMGFPGYFLIVADFIKKARELGIPVGPGRGSAAGSLVAYALGITNIDSIKYNLLFERFLNPDRISLPDIDIDFCYERRDEVIKYVTNKYGADNVGQIITFGQMKAKACIRDVGRALDMPYADVDRIAKLVPNTLNITIEEALVQEPKLKTLAKDDPKVGELIEAAIALEGLPRHASTHAAGVVIANKPLVDYLPLYKSQKEEVVTTQFPMKDVERIGLVKFDFLGLKTLTVIDKALKLIKKNRDVVIDLDNIPLDDSETYNLVATGNTNGIFQLESSGLKELLRKLKPETFEDMVAAVALYRPGPLQSGMVDDFINRKHKRVPIVYEVEQLKHILENTYGVMVYQEQVMEIAKVLAGYTPGDADVLRKAMGKKNDEVMLEQRHRFLDGAKKNGIPQRKAEKIFDLMAKFAGYGFNKSHSAAYALISYQTAYLKCHYPVEFMAALMGSDMNNTDQVVKYINECRDMSIAVDPPDINESSIEFAVKDGRIRFALAAVKNVGAAALEDVLRIREDGTFDSLVDFLSRLDTRKVNKKVVESLIKAGAFDNLGPGRGQVFNSLEAAMEIAQSVQRDRELGQGSIFDVLGGSGAAAQTQVNTIAEESFPGWTDKEALAFEKETLGFYFSSHPLTSHKKELALYTTGTVEEIKTKEDETEVTIGGIVTELKETVTKKGARMAFARIEDLSASIEVVIFSAVYKKSAELLASGVPLIIMGRVDRKDEEAKLVVNAISPIDNVTEIEDKLKVRSTHITAPVEALDTESLKKLREIIEENPGPSPVCLHMLYPGGRVVKILLSDKLKVSPLEGAFARIKELIDGAAIKVI